MTNLKPHLVLISSVLLLCSCSTPENIFSQITGIGTPPGKDFCFVPAEAYCSDDKEPSPEFPKKPEYADVEIPSYDEDKVVSGEAHGVKPENEDNSEAFSKLMEFCRKNSSPSIKLKEGDYYFAKGNLVFSGLKDFVFDGNGACFLINQEKIPAGEGVISIENCSNLEFKNTKIGVSGKILEKDESPPAVINIVDSNSLLFDSVKISSVRSSGFLFKGKTVRNVYMVNCGVTSCESGIRIVETGGLFSVNSCSFRNNKKDSIFIKGDSSDYFIKSCFFYHNHQNDVNITASKVFVTNCTFMHTGSIPVLVNSNAQDIIINESIFDGGNTRFKENEDLNSACIALLSSEKDRGISRILVEENKLLNFPNYSISLESVNHAMVKGNLFINRNPNTDKNKNRGGITLQKVNNAIVKKNLWEGKENISPGVFFNPDNTTEFILEDNIKE